MEAGTSPHGLRERKKDDTRRALIEMGYRLTLDRGFDGFTVAELTDAAGVSRRTFSNYFTSKAECVLAWGDILGEQAIAELAAADQDEPLHLMIRRLLRMVTAEADGEWGDFVQIVHSNPELRAEAAVADQRMATAIGAAVALRLGIAREDVVAQALGLFAMTACRVVLEQWLQQDRPAGREGLTSSLERVFLLLDPAALDALRHNAPPLSSGPATESN